MEYTNFIYFIAFLILISAPIAFVQAKKNNSNKLAFRKIQSMAAEMNNKVDIFDIWHKTAIGIDQAQTHLFFARESSKNPVVISIEIGLITDVSLERNLFKESDLELLELIIKTKSQTYRLEFFNSDIDGFVLSGQLQLAEKWKRFVADKSKNK